MVRGINGTEQPTKHGLQPTAAATATPKVVQLSYSRFWLKNQLSIV